MEAASSEYYTPYDTPALQFKEPTFSVTEHQLDMDEASPAVPPQPGVYQQAAEMQPTLPAEEIPEEEPGRMARPPTADLSRDPASLAPPEHVTPVILSSITDRKNSKVKGRAKQSYKPEQERRSVSPKRHKQLVSAPGIVAPPVGVVRTGMEPTVRHPKVRIADVVPRGRQSPPAPSYPIRDSSMWIQPDTQTPPPRKKPQASPKGKNKKLFFKFSNNHMEESRTEHQLPLHPLLEIQHAVPFRNRLLSQLFRIATAGERKLPKICVYAWFFDTTRTGTRK
jgi:hypothetical protein